MITLVDIIKSEEFNAQLQNAASLSYEKNLESGFAVYSDSEFKDYGINKAALGTEDKIYTDVSECVQHEPFKGFWVPLENYTILSIHFHPPNSRLEPSIPDLMVTNRTRLINYNLGTRNQVINPVSILGLVRRNPENIELLFYQERTADLIGINDFCKFVAEFYNRKRKSPKVDAYSVRAIGVFPMAFKSAEDVSDFLNSSGYYRSVFLKIEDGFKKQDLGRLREFKLAV